MITQADIDFVATDEELSEEGKGGDTTWYVSDLSTSITIRLLLESDMCFTLIR